MENTIQVELNSISAEIEIPDSPLHTNHKANATVVLTGPSGRNIRISGFTVWVSMQDTKLNVQVPNRSKSYKFWFSDMDTLKEVSDMIIQMYEHHISGPNPTNSSDDIPIIEPDEKELTLEDVPF